MDGLRCAPFKSQNMALNSAVTRTGWRWAGRRRCRPRAGRVEPDVRMNPVLLKPSSDVGSQVIVMGQVRGQMPAREYFRYKKQLLPEILAAYESLAAEYDVIVIEGAGSPAEINLKADDIVNMGLAKRVDAPVLLAGDIDRGGGVRPAVRHRRPAGARRAGPHQGAGHQQVPGRWGDPPPPAWPRWNKRPASRWWGWCPTSGWRSTTRIPWPPALDQTRVHKPLDVAVIRLPRISNFTDFAPLEQHPLVGVRYVTGAQALGTPDAVILPGTKSTLSDLLWLRQSGMEAALLKLAAAGTPVLGICGGYQMLGRTIADPDGAEGEAGRCCGGWACCRRTLCSAPKRPRTRVKGRALAGPFAGLRWKATRSTWAGPRRTAGNPSAAWKMAGPTAARRAACTAPTCTACSTPARPPPGWQTPCAGARGSARRGRRPSPCPTPLFRSGEFDRLAAAVRGALDMEAIYRMMED